MKGKEIKVGKSKIYLIDDNIICFIPVGDHDENTAIKVSYAIFELEKTVKEKAHILIDLTDAGRLSSKARKIYQANSNRENAGKSAMFGLNPVARVIASFIMTGFKTNSKINFFTTKESALNWLKK